MAAVNEAADAAGSHMLWTPLKPCYGLGTLCAENRESRLPTKIVRKDIHFVEISITEEWRCIHGGSVRGQETSRALPGECDQGPTRAVEQWQGGVTDLRWEVKLAGAVDWLASWWW